MTSVPRRVLRPKQGEESNAGQAGAGERRIWVSNSSITSNLNHMPLKTRIRAVNWWGNSGGI